MSIKIKKSEFKKLFDLACPAWKPKLEEKLKQFIFDSTIEFEEKFVEQMKNTCTDKQLIVFNQIFKNYLPKNITDEVNNIETLKKYIGKSFKPPYSLETKDKLEKSLNAHYVLTHVTTIYNEGVILDWKKTVYINIYHTDISYGVFSDTIKYQKGEHIKQFITPVQFFKSFKIYQS